MKLSELLRNLNFDCFNFQNAQVEYISEDSRDVKPNTLFFCVSGYKFDGHLFAGEAVKKGAVALVVSKKEEARKLKERHKLPVILSRNIRKDISIIASRFYGNPHKKLKIIGITGTNGKTTTAYMLYTILNKLEEKTGLIGTVEYKTENWSVSATRTTPSAINLNRTLKRMYEEGCRWVICEVSSHALCLDRVSGISFSGGIFTNLSPEHLDFHKDMNSYFLAKYNFLNLIRKDGIFVVNSDDPYGKTIYGLRGLYHFPIVSYGKKGEFSISKLVQSQKGMEMTVNYQGKGFSAKTNLKGEHNAYNLLAAVSLLKSFGIEGIENRFWKFKIPGRLEEIAENVFIDYAHTPDALLKVLTTLRKIAKGKLIVVFGCGGDRDREKRPAMGKVASSLADIVIITNDNPRTEDPERITSEILKGVKNKEKVKIILDRKRAIETGLELKNSKDILLIAGKGHETYQEIGNDRFPFSDKEVVKEIIGDKQRACINS